MRFKLALLLAGFVLVPPCQTTGSERPLKSARYTIQVASFPNPVEARQLVARLERLGERVTASVVDLRGRGSWTRVFVGTFATVGEARGHATRLLREGAIREFFIRDADSEQWALSQSPQPTGLAASPDPFGSDVPHSSQGQLTRRVFPSTVRFSPIWPEKGSAVVAFSLRSSGSRTGATAVLPLAKPLRLSITPNVDTRLLPRPDPASLAYLLITGTGAHQHGPRQAGLWITGDTAEGLARLRWIAGEQAADLITVESDGRVKLDVAKAAGADSVPPLEGLLAVTHYICANEGVLLLVQLTHARHRYRLHFASQAPTRGSFVQVTSGLNLDNNFDSRINPNRRLGRKMDNERPPDGFDSLVAINPVARWFNQQTNQLVPGALIAFHELAEAHAKLEMGLDYLGDATQSGAHGVALARERRLKSQRPHAGVVLTDGPNRVLRSEEEIREFFSQLSQPRP